MIPFITHRFSSLLSGLRQERRLGTQKKPPPSSLIIANFIWPNESDVQSRPLFISTQDTEGVPNKRSGKHDRESKHSCRISECDWFILTRFHFRSLSHLRGTRLRYEVGSLQSSGNDGDMEPQKEKKWKGKEEEEEEKEEEEKKRGQTLCVPSFVETVLMDWGLGRRKQKGHSLSLSRRDGSHHVFCPEEGDQGWRWI
ncbi:hypothetical protein IE53DRAFT_184209 [Violaceomyces palustris]|uniref:Uncharacterized protein n=1 Tax=Violaceomyces palustris TaxID=1673888 RepID=A0ACD0NS87_9BASI|nr:hypothetical protein IE53DRAFT_184209 [Violaceomyces palustris]